MVWSVLQVMRQASSHENWQSQTHLRWPFKTLCSSTVKLSWSMLTLQSLIFLSAEQVAMQRLLGEIFILRMQSSWTLAGLFLRVMCSTQQFMYPSLSPNAIRYRLLLIVIVRMLQSDSIVFLCSLSLFRSHFVTTPPSSPNTIELSLGCRAAQLMGLLFLCSLTTFLALRSKMRSPPSSQAVQIALSPLLKQPTAVTLPLKLVSNER